MSYPGGSVPNGYGSQYNPPQYNPPQYNPQQYNPPRSYPPQSYQTTPQYQSQVPDDLTANGVLLQQIQYANHNAYHQNRPVQYSYPGYDGPSDSYPATVEPQSLQRQPRQHPVASQPQAPSQYAQHRPAQPPPSTMPVQTDSRPSVAVTESSNSTSDQLDPQTLLMSMAEEYFEAARKIGPGVSLSMKPELVGEYQKLIATGLGCLEAALSHVRLSPRNEAKIRLRYAGVVHEETDNFMEAETTLAKGIKLCDRHHFVDLRYNMLFLQARINFKKSPKSALIALDSHISDAETYKHISWVYAFRFLRAQLSMASGSSADTNAAILNLRTIAKRASERGDRSINLTASLMEALAHLKSPGPDSVEQLQRALASALAHQLNESSRSPQLAGLIHILDTVCSFLQKPPKAAMDSLRQLQQVMDKEFKESTWGCFDDSISLPINPPQEQSQILHHEDCGVLSTNSDGQEVLKMSFMSKNDAYAITHLLSGAILFYRDACDGEGKARRFLQRGLTALQADAVRSEDVESILPVSQELLRWRGTLLCYFHIYLAFTSAATSDWLSVRQHLVDFKKPLHSFQIPLEGALGHFSTYLSGVYFQGSGNLDLALKMFSDAKFSLNATDSLTVIRDISILAAINRINILQEPSRRNEAKNAEMFAQLAPFCKNHVTKGIEAAFNIMRSLVPTDPPTPMLEHKNYVSGAISGAKATGNMQLQSLTLLLMYRSFFENIVGDQAEKNARAAFQAAKQSGSSLWMSVAAGCLSQCLETQGKREESHAFLQEACKLREEALSRT